MVMESTPINKVKQISEVFVMRELQKLAYTTQGGFEVQDKIINHIEENYIPKPKGLIDSIKFFFKHAWKGAIMYSIQYAYQSFIMWLGFLLFYPLPYLSCVGIFIVLRMFRSGIVNLKPTNHYKPEALKQIEG